MRAAEIDYFRAFIQGVVVFMLASAVMGFFMGRGDNKIVMFAQLGGIWEKMKVVETVVVE